jgi:hypothetical protein
VQRKPSNNDDKLAKRPRITIILEQKLEVIYQIEAGEHQVGCW